MSKTKILIAIDDPSWAAIIVQSLFNLIKKENTEIFLLNVLETTIAEEEYFYSAPEKFIKHEARKANFAYVQNLLEQNKFNYQFIFKEGDTAENIINTARELDAGLVAVGSHNKKIFETLLLGSVAYKVSRTCKSPVMIISTKYHIHNTKKQDFNVLLAVDRSKTSRFAAQSLAGLIDLQRANIDILNVIIPPQKVIPPEAYVYTNLGKIIDESKLVSGDLLDSIEEIVKEHEPHSIKKVSLMGEPDDLIIDYAEKNSIDLIVMGSHGKKELAALFLGSISTKISEKSEIPLLIIKKK